MSNIVKLFEGDMRCENLLLALEKLTYEQGDGMPLPLIIGTIDLLKDKIIEDNR